MALAALRIVPLFQGYLDEGRGHGVNGFRASRVRLYMD